MFPDLTDCKWLYLIFGRFFETIDSVSDWTYRKKIEIFGL